MNPNTVLKRANSSNSSGLMRIRHLLLIRASVDVKRQAVKLYRSLLSSTLRKTESHAVAHTQQSHEHPIAHSLQPIVPRECFQTLLASFISIEIPVNPP